MTEGMESTPIPRYPPAMDATEKAAFLHLLNTPLHATFGARRVAFEEEMARWLTHSEAWIREAAVERLATAVLWENLPRDTPAGQARDHWDARLGWLFGALEAANRACPGVIQLFVDATRFRTPSGAQLPVMREWFDRLEGEPPAGLDPDHVLGARIMAGEPRDWRTDEPVWLDLLDHRSDWVRGCAAYRLGNDCDEDTEPSAADLFRLVGGKEIERPGIAGPFWSPRSHDSQGDEAEAAMLWMMDLLERRRGPPPAAMPFNDIAFHLHELCCASPAMVDRMLKGGFVDLALMTATELDTPVDGMASRLDVLAGHSDPAIAIRAANHLAAHYGQYVSRK